jgi:DNA repair exonuclease SbcCD ATPase subunit
VEKLKIRKVIILSYDEQASIEIPFYEGLNFIIGENKTGKSTIIKTIFYCLGCDVKYDNEWNNLKKRILICFSYGEKYFLIERIEKEFFLFHSDAYIQNISFMGNYSSNEFAKKLSNIFGLDMTWLNSKGIETCVAPQYLFSFQYIDQDRGWHSIAGSFSNLKYIPGWKQQIIKYVIGYQNEKYFNIKKLIEERRVIIRNMDIKLKNLREFIKTIVSKMEVIQDVNTAIVIYDNDNVRTNKLLEQLSYLEKDKINISKKIAVMQNDEYEKELLLSTLSINTEDLLSDLKFASGNGEILVCPFCGLEHDNGLTSRSEIIKDIQKANNLKDQINRELNILKHDIKRQKESIEKVENEYNILKIEVDRLEKEASIVETYKCEGKKEMINNGEIEIKNIQNELFNCIYIQNNLKKDLKDIESKPRK